MNLVELLEESRHRYGNKRAVSHGEQNITYSELNVGSARFAAALRAFGIRKGDRVALLMSNSPEFVLAYFGTVRSGAVAVLLDPKYKRAELSVLFKDCNPRVLVSETACLDSLAYNPEELKRIELVINVSHEPCKCSMSLADFMAAPSGLAKTVRISDADPAHIAYTSGPSFTPRGVLVSHGNLVKEIQTSAMSFEQSEKDVVVQFALPMHHVIGLVVIMLTSIYCGSSLIILNGVSTENLMAAVERHKITMFMGVPFIHAMLLRKVEEEGIQHDLGSLRVCASAGDILPKDIVENYRKLLNLRLINFYGLTETLGHVTCEPLHGLHKAGSVGPALPQWRVTIVGPEGDELPCKQPGQVIISGPMMDSYYHKRKATAEVIKDGRPIHRRHRRDG